MSELQASGGRKPPAGGAQQGAYAPRSPWLALVALLWLTAGAFADEDVPLVGRPADLPFSGASAGFVAANGAAYRCPFEVDAAVTSSDVEEHQPVTLTLTVRARGSVRRPPSRLDLQQVPALKRRFHIEDVTDGQTEAVSPTAWRWVYRLRPRGPSVEEVPGVPFVFYNPDLRPAEKAFQVIWSDPVPLRVRASERDAPPVRASDAILALATGPGMLRGGGGWPATGLWILAGIAPPVLCALWYLRWRRRHPDEARRTHHARSHAARTALSALEVAGRDHGRPSAERVAGAIGGYLAARYGLARAELTPAEAVGYLRVIGVPEALAERGGQLLERASAVRFGPEEAALAEEAREWVLALEEEPCPPSF